jgi:hypothetical protein
MNMVPLIPIAMQLAQFAPGIIKLLTGSDKAEEVAGKIVGVAKAVTGTADGPEALAKLQADPEKVMQFQLAFAAQQAELEKAYLADVQSARARDVELHKAGFQNRRADVMVALDVLGLIACLLVLVFFRASLPGEVVGILSTIAGIFGACLRDAHQFEFGSSRSSQAKDATISKLSGA